MNPRQAVAYLQWNRHMFERTIRDTLSRFGLDQRGVNRHPRRPAVMPRRREFESAV
jgi:hypothetical protein